jgi:hypothetical protein
MRWRPPAHLESNPRQCREQVGVRMRTTRAELARKELA